MKTKKIWYEDKVKREIEGLDGIIEHELKKPILSIARSKWLKKVIRTRDLRKELIARGLTIPGDDPNQKTIISSIRKGFGL